MRLGVYIGSFNPMHDGQKHVAEFVINNNEILNNIFNEIFF